VTMADRPELVRTEEGLALEWDGMTLRGDLTALIPRIRPDRLNGELIVKAAKYEKLYGGGTVTVLDATAGLGEDSFLLAAKGFNVLMYERDELIFRLLEDSLRRAADDPLTCEAASRIKAVCGDSIDAMREIASRGDPGSSPDVIYLDPMFPARKKSGLIKKKFQILQQLESPEAGDSLIRAAVDAGPRRIIVKRPAGAKPLGGVSPSYSVKGGIIRYDCIILRP